MMSQAPFVKGGGGKWMNVNEEWKSKCINKKQKNQEHGMEKALKQDRNRKLQEERRTGNWTLGK